MKRLLIFLGTLTVIVFALAIYNHYTGAISAALWSSTAKTEKNLLHEKGEPDVKKEKKKKKKN